MEQIQRCVNGRWPAVEGVYPPFATKLGACKPFSPNASGVIGSRAGAARLPHRRIDRAATSLNAGQETGFTGEGDD